MRPTRLAAKWPDGRSGGAGFAAPPSSNWLACRQQGVCMVYLLHEFSRASATPWLYAARLGRQMLSEWPAAFAGNPFINELAATCDLGVRLLQRYEKPEFGIKSVRVNGETVAVSERVALAKPFCRLLHFRRDGAAGDP